MTSAIAIELTKKTAIKWNYHNAPSLGASLAFYTLLSLAPLVVLVVAFCGVFLTQPKVEQEFLADAQLLIGDVATGTLRSLVENAGHSKSGIIASTLALATVLFGASGVFVELRNSLNIIWDAPETSGSIGTFITQRLATFLMVLALGALIVTSLLLNAGLTFFENYFKEMLPAQSWAVDEFLNTTVSFVLLTIFFGLIFKFVPDVRIAWRDVGIGAVVTSLLFAVGRGLLAYYLATTGVGSTYGAAGSVVALVVWVYYSAQIFFFGAVFTRVYADSCGSKSSRKAMAAIN